MYLKGHFAKNKKANSSLYTARGNGFIFLSVWHANIHWCPKMSKYGPSYRQEKKFGK